MSLALLFNQPQTASITLAQETNGHGTGASYTKAFTSSVVSGNLLVIVLTDTAGTSGTVLGISDTQGNSYTQVSSAYASGVGQTSIWCAVAAGSGANSVTVTSDATSPNLFAYLNEFTSSNGWPATPLDTSASATGTGLTASSGNITTASGGELILGYFPEGIKTAGSGFTLLTDANAVEYKTQATAGTVAASGTQFISGAWQAFVVAFKTGATPPSGGAAYWRTITVDHTKLNSDQTNFPAMVAGTVAEFKSVANGGHIASTDAHQPFDLVFWADSAFTTKLAFEISYWDPTTGAIECFVLLPSVSASTDTVFYATYDDSTITTDQGDPVTLWATSNYVAVFHFGYTSGSVIKDSTGNGYDGTLVGGATQNNVTVTAETGVSSPMLTLASGGQYAQFSNYFGNQTALTVDLWINCLPVNAEYVPVDLGQLIWVISQDDGFTIAAQFVFNDASHTPYSFNDWNGLPFSSWTPPWYLLTLTAAPGAQIGYVNASEQGSTSAATITNWTGGGGKTTIGGRGDTHSYDATGSFDELRVSNVVRSQDWISAQYANQLSPTTFLAFGAEQAAVLTQNYTKTLVESFTLGEALYRQLDRVYAETITLQSLLLKAPGHAVLDTVSVTESLQRQPQKSVGETLSVTEQMARMPGKAFTELFSLTEQLARTANRLLTESFSLTEQLARQTGRLFAESLSLTEQLARNATRSFTETLTVSEQIAKKASRLFTESLSLADQITHSIGRVLALADSYGLTEQITKSVSKVYTESISLTEKLARGTSRFFTEAFSLTDQFSRVIGRALTLTDSVALTEQISRVVGRTITEAFTLSDVLTTGAQRVFTQLLSDTLAFSESLGRSVQRQILETLGLGDSLKRTGQKVTADAIAITDYSFTFSGQKTVADTVAITDHTIARSIQRIIGDAFSVAEQIVRSGQKSIADIFTVSDFLATSRAKILALVDSFSITDSIGKRANVLLAEALTLADLLGSLSADVLTLMDAFVLSESIVKQVQRGVVDTFSLSDALTRLKTRAIAFIDSFILTESLQKRTGKSVGDSIQLLEHIGRAIGRAFSEAFTLEEFFTVQELTVLVLSDEISLEDFFLRGTEKLLTELLTLSEQLTRGITHSFFDQLSLADVLDWIVLGPVLFVYRLRQYYAQLWRRYFAAEVLLRSYTAEDSQAGVAETVQRNYTASQVIRNWSATDDMIYADPKDAESTEDFQIDWSPVIRDDSISSSRWEVPTDLTNVEANSTATVTLVRLSGGIANKRYLVKNVVTLASGQVMVQSIQLPVI